MSKLDTLFLTIIRDPQFADMIGNDASRVRNIDDGKRAANKYVRTVAEVLEQLNKKIEEKRMEMRLKQQKGNIVIDTSEYQAIYRKVVSLLTK